MLKLNAPLCLRLSLDPSPTSLITTIFQSSAAQETSDVTPIIYLLNCDGSVTNKQKAQPLSRALSFTNPRPLRRDDICTGICSTPCQCSSEE